MGPWREVKAALSMGVWVRLPLAVFAVFTGHGKPCAMLNPSSISG